MPLEAFTLWTLAAGVLLGIALSIEALVVRDLIAAIRHIAAHVRRRPSPH